MKKILLSLFTLAFCIIALTACSSSKNKNSWLDGKWYSNDWNKTYIFEKYKEFWKISDNEGNVISKKASESKDSSNKELTLVDKDGTKFVINKIDKTHIKFQQVSKKGLIGTTASVEFVKK